jgi:dTDP-glucose pyrophosphorylase
MNDKWKNTLIDPKCSIREALAIIDDGSFRVALVADQNKKLLGIVSDGDIRRGLLSGISLDNNVSNVMTTNPTTATTEVSNEELVEIMKSKEILSIPLIENDVIVGLKSLHESLKIPKLKNPVFIMAGGFGKRLKPLTDNSPKPMLKIGDKPILEIILLNLIEAGFSDFYISTHYMPKVIIDYFGDGSAWNVSIKYVHEESPLGTGGALGLLPADICKLPLIMINGDILTNVNYRKILDFHNNESASATVCCREYQFQIPYGVIYSEAGRVKSIEEKPNKIFYINAGIYVVNREIIDRIKCNEKVDMPVFLEREALDRDGLVMFPIHEYWLDIGRIDDFNRAQVDISTLRF